MSNAVYTSEKTANQRADGALWLTIAAVAVVTALAAAIQLPLALNHDVAWIATGAQRLLTGGVFGRDVVDVNPPLAWWVMLVPAAAARWFGFDLGGAVKVYVFALGLLSLAICLRIIATNRSTTQLTAFALSLAAIFFLLPNYDFGQREHLMAMLVLPYLVLAAQRGAGEHRFQSSLNFSVGVGAIAAVGLCLKPHFLIIPGAVELWLVWRLRSIHHVLRGETVAMGLAGVSYLAAIYLFSGDYIETILPSAVATYGAYSNPLGMVAKASTLSLAGVVSLALVWFCVCRGGDRELVTILLLSGLGAFGAALLQSKGWAYHLLPARSFISIAGVAAFCSIVGPGRLLSAAAIATLIAVLAIPLRSHLVESYGPDGTQRRVDKLAEVFAAAEGAPRSVAAILTSPRDVHPAVVQAGAYWTLRECCVHFIAAAVNNEHGRGSANADQRRDYQIALRQLRSVIAQLVARPPDVIVIDDAPHKLAIKLWDFDWLAYFNRDAAFQTFLADYKEQLPVDHFRVFVRSDG